MPSALLRFLLPAIAVAAVHGAPRCDGDGDTTAQLQLKERSRSDRVLQSKLQSRLTAFDNSLYWQGYGSESLASYFIGFLGHDTVQVGGLNITAKVGLNLMGNALSGNFYQSVEADAAVLGLLPGCFTGGCNPAYYDDLLSTMAREGKIRRAFSLCFDDSPRGGGKLFLGRPEIPTDAVKIPLHPLTDGLRPYSPLSTFGPSGAGVEFFFGSKRVASRSSEEWNRLIRSGAGYSDTGTPGLVLPSSVLDEVLTELRRKLLADEMCASMWGPYLPKLTAQHLDSLTVSSTAASCALRHVEDLVVQLGPDISLNISKSSFFYEAPSCSKQLKVSWSSAGNAEIFIFGTALNWGKTWLYDTSDLEAPKLILLGNADGCSANWAELATQSAPGQLLGLELPVSSPIELQGLPAQVLGRDGTMTASVMIGSPPQEMTMQLDTGSQKLVGVHENCRNLGFCFLVQPENVTNTALLPGPEYGTEKCQRQVQVLTEVLSTTLSCSHLKSKLLCECTSQEECLRQILSAASQVQPSESCARDRRTCGEKMDFHPDASESFRPSVASSHASSSAGSAGSARSFLGSKRTEQCQRYRYCSDALGTARAPESPQSMARLAPEIGYKTDRSADRAGRPVERATGSKPKEAAEDAWHTDATWKIPKQLPDRSQKETGEIERQSSKEQNHRWEEVLKESPPVPSVPRDTFGEIDRTTGSKQPKDAWHTDATWKSPKQLPDSPRENHRWEEVLKESPPVPPVPRDTFGEIHRTTGSKQPKETVEDAWHTDATWKSPKQVADSSEKETGEIERQSSKEQKHRWEEVLKESPPVPPVPSDTFGEIDRTAGSKQPKDASPTDASPVGTWKTPNQVPDSSEKETAEIQRQSSGEKHLWEEVMKESPPVPPVPSDTFGEIHRATGSKQPKETVEDASPTDANIGTWKSLKQLPDSSEKETAEIQRQSSREKHPWEEVLKESPPVLPVLRDAFGEIDRAASKPKEAAEEIGQKTSSADPADGADRPLERATASMQPKETLEEKLKLPDAISASPISLAPVSDFMDGLPPQPVIGEPQKFRGK